MDLPDLLSPERVACRRELGSKKRALEELSTLLFTGIDVAGESDGELDDTKSLSRREKRKREKAEREKAEHQAVNHAQDVLDGLIERERLGSTGLGHGVAIPHSRCEVEEPLAALLTLEDGVDFSAADGNPVDLIVGLLVPTHCTDGHLKILASLAERLENAEYREALRRCRSDKELLEAAREPVHLTGD